MNFKNHWRLIDTGLLSGVENMAVDEALLACFEPELSVPVLRFYGWNPAAFSFGRFQQPADIFDHDRCRVAGIQTVRRITGGGVIYHSEELTYSLVCPIDFIPGGHSVKEAFFFLTSFLLAFYHSLGLPACYAVDHFGGDRKFGERTPLCFAGLESCDILIHGRKIGGNAQRRLKQVIFQHGSIPLRQMAAGGDACLLHPDAEVTARTTALEDQGVMVERDVLVARLQAAFEQSFGAVVSLDGLTEKEQKTAAGYMQKTE